MLLAAATLTAAQGSAAQDTVSALPDAPEVAAAGQQSSSSGNVPAAGAQGESRSQPTQTSATPSQNSSGQGQDQGEAGGKQPKRILWIIPNYRSVSADTHLPRQSTKEKFVLATEDSFDYSSFIFAGMLAGVGQAEDSYPEFHQGAAGYARYYWHSFADQAVGNYLTEAIFPAVTREDPRYYTLWHGGFFRRTSYAFTRLLITRTDSGGSTFNFSEIVGNGAGAGISDLYYPRRERTWTKTGQKWVTQVALDGVFNIFKEFWPNISHTILRQK